MARPIPQFFCWTKFGIEAGESIEKILQRKERERKANGGIFLWGIGNALGPSLAYLLEKVSDPEIIFSPIRSAPKKIDVAPSAVVAWTSGEGIDGRTYNLPPASMVTSRASEKGNRAHYALVCRTQNPLSINMGAEIIKYGHLRNILTGNPLGYSQVTSVVMREDDVDLGGQEYPAAIRADLVYPYFIKLLNPEIVTNRLNKLPSNIAPKALQEQRELELV